MSRLKSDLPPVLIVGLGLIGGSVALALRNVGATVRGVTRSPATLKQALELEAIEGGALSLEDEVAQAGLILVAAPTRTSIRLLSRIGELAQEGTVITDACSSKQEVVRAMDALPPMLRSVGGHPMAGTEKSGIASADSQLFREAKWVFTPTRHTDHTCRDICEAMATLCGATPVWVDAAEHDRAVAAISHLPLLTAAALVLAAEESGSELAWQLAAGGFRDSTRLAAGDVEMSADLALTNAAAIHEACGRFASELEMLVSAARDPDTAKLAEMLERAAGRRRAMYGGDR